MSTALSSRRYVGLDVAMRNLPPRPEQAAEKPFPWAVFGLIGGLTAMVIGGVLAIDALLIAGFLPFTLAGMYLNAKFWAYLHEKGYYSPDKPNYFL